MLEGDWRASPIVDARLRATLAFLEKMTLAPATLAAADAEAAMAAGVTAAALRDAAWAGALFNVIDRVADALGFAIPSPEGFAEGARALLKRGYRM